MRSSLLAFTALLAVAHVACSGDPGSNDGSSDPSAPGDQAPPPQDLASATVPGTPGDPGTGTGTGTSRSGDSYAPIGDQSGTGSNPGAASSSSGGPPVDPNAGAGSPPTTTCTVAK